MTYQKISTSGNVSQYSGGMMTARQKRRSEATQQRRKEKKARKGRKSAVRSNAAPDPTEQHLTLYTP
jgi:hypothetical protein